MNKNPEISIIITHYNYQNYITRCVRSCLEQKLINFEIIIIDDKSNEDTICDILNPFIKNIKIIKNIMNLGTPKTSMKAIKQSKGRFFIRVDADDYINEYTCFFLRNILINNKKYLGISCDYFYVNNQGDKIEKVSWKDKPIACGVLYNRDKFLELGGYDITKNNREEYWIRKKLGTKYNIFNLPIPLYRYRMHDNNKTKSKEFLENN